MKKNILASLYIIVFVLLIYLLQIYVIGDKTLFSVKPNLILISVLVVSLWYGLYAGTVYSFLIGLFTDMLYSSNIGMFTIAYTIAGMVVGLLHYYNQRESKISVIYATFICVAAFELVEYVYYATLTDSFFNLLYLLKQIIISSVLNIVITYAFYSILLKVTDSIESKIRKEGAL